MEKQPSSRNPIARACGRVHKPKVVPAKKGKGSYRRVKKPLDLISDSR